MKKSFLIGVIVLGFLLVSNIVFGDFYVIATKPRLAGQEIKALPYTITVPGFYYLTKNLTATGTGITVDADHVVIDLMGFNIIGPGRETAYNDGIKLNNTSNVEIRNGTIRNFGVHGVSGTTSFIKGIRIINIRAISNGYNGISLTPTVGSLVKGCTTADNDHDGIAVGRGATVSGNISYENGRDGIFFNYPGRTIIGNTVYNNAENGIYTSSGATVTSNTAYGNTENGFRIGSGCTVTNNTAYSNNQYGFYLSSHNLFWQNTGYSNTLGNYSGCSTCTIGENYVP